MTETPIDANTLSIDIKSDGKTIHECSAYHDYPDDMSILYNYVKFLMSKDMGAESISARYVGWNNSGVSNLKVTDSAKAVMRLGGKKALKELNSTNFKKHKFRA